MAGNGEMTIVLRLPRFMHLIHVMQGRCRRAAGLATGLAGGPGRNIFHNGWSTIRTFLRSSRKMLSAMNRALIVCRLRSSSG